MDPFVFDQKFARFMAQVDTGDIGRGTELYEAGHVRLQNLSEQRIWGSVTEGKHGVFQASLAPNDQGGFSGSCSCDAFFNCRHSYALARAARDQIAGRSATAPANQPAGPGAAKTDEDVLAARLGRRLTVGEKRAGDELRKLAKRARDSAWTLYPKDLYGLCQKRAQLVSLPGEPLRDLKRALEKERPEGLPEFADLLRAYFAFRGFEASPEFMAIAGNGFDSTRFEAAASTRQNRDWDRPPLKLSYRFHLDSAGEENWYRASASYEIAGGGYSETEARRLVEANGELVNLPGKGWRRIELSAGSHSESILAALGIDPGRGNHQRIHVTQLAELIPIELLDEEGREELANRTRILDTLIPARVPRSLMEVLRSYQEDGFRFLCRLSELGLSGILADDMGLGKTVQALAWLLWLAERGESPEEFRALVICPKSVMDNWVREPDKFKTGLVASRYEPGTDSSHSSNILVANYAQLRLNSDFFLNVPWHAVILDEAQYIKSPTSQTTKVAYQLRAEHRLILTGTPIENSLTDLWSLMRFAMPRLLGPQAAFKTNYDSGRNPNAHGALKKRIRPFLLRRLKSEVAKDLPDRIEEELRCDLEGRQRALYDAELERARNAVRAIGDEGDWNRERFGILQALLRLRQICCDPRLLDTRESQDEPSAKISALIDLLEPLLAEGHKALVFSQFVSMLDLVKRELDQRGITSLTLTGKTRDRSALIDRFQSAEGEPVFLLSLKAAGSGLNLTAASYVALLDPWWNPAVEAQAIDRAHRIGQRSQVIAYRFIAKDTIEEKIRQIQTRKASLAESIIGEESLSEALGLEELRELLA